MSLMKPFLLLYGLERVGEQAVFERVGMRPSDQPFHSLKQLAADRSQPRNPMLNSGAISLVELLPGRRGDERCGAFQQWLQSLSGLDLAVDPTILASVRSLPNDTNQAIAQMLKNHGQLRHRSTALDTYNQLCCLRVTVAQLARLGELLAQPQAQIQRRSQQIVNALMLTCGVYEASGDWAVRIGLPTKSGVSGGILAIVPGDGAIAIYAPTIDQTGNSVAGAALLQAIVDNLGLGIF
jgi:glutaminase